MELGPENKYYIRCASLPVALLDKATAKEHFSKFGRIISIHLRPKTKGCTVEYADEASSLLALANAGRYDGKSFTVTRGPKSPKKTAKKELWTPHLEVQQELEAMSGVGVYKLGGKLKEKKKPSKATWGASQKKAAKVSEQTSSSNVSALSEQRELLKIIKQPAQSVEEKFRALETRDKLIRLRTQKHVDLGAKRMAGTCPDMCPEKERLMREAQHQVALYEQEPTTKTLNPCLAVKQYSRSSADQEAPLPHELRPVNVLQMTMGYLMHKIIPLCDNPEVNLAEWYHFLWDRTRGIRKDITQQELCCHGSVQLVEQCARFHIHCSARLVAEDPSVFDQKINTENLTKCLQTLKYMYHDLRCKNESCPNEAEFRGYIILLNLNDGNFMWEVQQLRDEIQKSAQVQFALNVYSALDKNNYVKFFKLVKSTTYLNACILLRYFVQVRVKALRTILKSFSPRGVTQFPLEELKDILAFEGSASTRDFVEYYGLYMSNIGANFYLDRSSFNIPELPYSLDRAIFLVEAKRTLSIGEIICGGELPLRTFELHQPHSSFDEFGLINVKEYFTDVDLNFMQSVDEEKPEDKSVLNLRKDSRSNSPFDTVDSSDSRGIFGNKKSIFGRSEKSQDSIFGQKPIQESIFGKKTQQETIFGEVKHMETQSQPPSSDLSNQGNIFEGGFGQKPNVFEQTSKSVFGQSRPVHSQSIFGKTLKHQPKPIGIFGQNLQQQLPTSSIFQQPPQTKSSIFAKPTTTTSSNIFYAKSTTGGFTFKLSPTKEGNILQNGARQRKIEEDQILELQKREEENIRQKLLQEKLQKELKQKEQEEERQRLQEIERQKKFAAEEARRKVIVAQRQKDIEHHNTLEEERRMQQQRELARKLELERQKLEEHKKMQEIRRTVSKLVKELLDRVEEKNKIDRLNEIKEKIVNRKIKYFVVKWRNNVALQSRKRKAIDDWPIWVNSVSPEEEARELMQDNQKSVLMDMKRYKIGYATKIEIPKKFNLKQIYYGDIVTELLRNNVVVSHIFWKIDVCLPTINESKTNLKKVEEHVQILLHLDDVTNSLVGTNQLLGKTVTYCIKKHDKFYKDEATDGFIFINDVFTEEFYSNLKQTIENHKSDVVLPIALILSNSNYDEERLDNLMEENLISNYAVFFNQFLPKNLEVMLKNALSFLAGNLPKQPSIELDDFRSFLTKFLVGETWERINSFAEHNRPYGMCLTHPKTVFYLYHEILNRLQKIVFNQHLLTHKDFPKVFLEHLPAKSPTSLPCDRKYFPGFWKNDSYNRKLRRIFDHLRLPDDVRLNWPPADIVELEDAIHGVCRQCSCPERSPFAIVSAIVRKLERLGNFADIRYMMWTDVMRMLAVEKLKTVDFTLREPFLAESALDELFVVYDPTDLERFNGEYWFYVDPAIQAEIDCAEIVIEESEDEAACEDEEDGDEFDLEGTLGAVTAYDAERERVIARGKSQMKELREMLDDLEESMEIQKKIGGRFQETLSLALSSSR